MPVSMTEVKYFLKKAFTRQKSITGAPMGWNPEQSLFPTAMSWDDFANPGWVTKSFQAYWSEGYSINPIVYSCIEGQAWACAAIPLRLYRSTGQTDRPDPEVQDGAMAELLRYPNDEYGMSQLIYQAVVSYKVAGNAYFHLSGPDEKGLGIPKYIDVTPPNWMLPVPKSNMRQVWYYSYLIPSETDAQMDPRVICHVKTYNPIYPYLGLPPLMAAARSIDANNAGRVWNYRLTQNSAAPSGILSPDPAPGAPPPNPSQLMAMREDVQKNWAGQMNAGVPVIVPGSLKYQAMAFSPVDMMWDRGQTKSAIEICNVLNYPTQLLGIEGSNTYSNYKEARRALYTDNCIPMMKIICEALTAHLQERFNDHTLYVSFNIRDIDALANDQLIEAQRLAISSWLTVDQKREEQGIKAIGGEQGAAILVPAATSTLADIVDPGAHEARTTGVV
jgi:HK97 family phage portal protein